MGGSRKGGVRTVSHLLVHDALTLLVSRSDIAGFTAWSSSRSPVDVFTMLECLYGSFDHLAKRRGVFKIETIGDCYVAVTGLPTPRDDHALCMAKFARDMMEAWEEQQMRLTATLGTGLLDLGLRVGMHSGPVTAGVLRGDRARFQLFGDTGAYIHLVFAFTSIDGRKHNPARVCHL